MFIILQPLTLMPSVLAFIFGTFIGSFLNVCIARIPDGKSIVKPPSHCPNCLKMIPFYDNIPFILFNQVFPQKPVGEKNYRAQGNRNRRPYVVFAGAAPGYHPPAPADHILFTGTTGLPAGIFVS